MRDESGCKRKKAVGKIGVIIGAVAFALVALIVIVVLVMVKLGCLSRVSYLMLAKEDQREL